MGVNHATTRGRRACLVGSAVRRATASTHDGPMSAKRHYLRLPRAAVSEYRQHRRCPVTLTISMEATLMHRSPLNCDFFSDATFSRPWYARRPRHLAPLEGQRGDSSFFVVRPVRPGAPCPAGTGCQAPFAGPCVLYCRRAGRRRTAPSWMATSVRPTPPGRGCRASVHME
jgi:hypothetical protein